MAAGIVTWLPRPAPYGEVWAAMQAFTAARTSATVDEVWLCEHPPVYTLGQAGKPQHILDAGSIQVVQTDRGGQVTYHGPGQVIAYALIDLRRAGLFVKAYVHLLEEAAIATLVELGVSQPCRVQGAPGVYVMHDDGMPSKIAALGVKIRNGCTYHGVALNVDMDLAPFSGINPCGMADMRTTDVASCRATPVDLVHAGDVLAAHILARLDLARANQGASPAACGDNHPSINAAHPA